MLLYLNIYRDNKVDGANMGPIWGRQDPDGPHELCYLGIFHELTTTHIFHFIEVTHVKILPIAW